LCQRRTIESIIMTGDGLPIMRWAANHAMRARQHKYRFLLPLSSNNRSVGVPKTMSLCFVGATEMPRELAMSGALVMLSVGLSQKYHLVRSGVSLWQKFAKTKTLAVLNWNTTLIYSSRIPTKKISKNIRTANDER
jgi:hypothetical protein